MVDERGTVVVMMATGGNVDGRFGGGGGFDDRFLRVADEKDVLVSLSLQFAVHSSIVSTVFVRDSGQSMTITKSNDGVLVLQVRSSDGLDSSLSGFN